MPDQSTDEDVRASDATPSGYIRADDVARLAGALERALFSDGEDDRAGPLIDAAERLSHMDTSSFRPFLRALSGGQHG